MSQTDTASHRNMGPLYAALLGAAWVTVHLYAVFGHTIGEPWWATFALILVQLWLYTGLFIVAHDTMHGSLVPGNEAANKWIGRLIMTWYAGFSWDSMRTAHHQHHDTPGTADDPDFNADDPHRFWPWYIKFFLRYFSWRQVVVLAAIGMLYMALGASYPNLLLMWAVPAILSSVQLFYFGTYLTHRHADDFPDEHKARTNAYPRWLSLLTCFHFGYHHEHHLYPHEPWWRLPARKFEVAP